MDFPGKNVGLLACKRLFGPGKLFLGWTDVKMKPTIKSQWGSHCHDQIVSKLVSEQLGLQHINHRKLDLPIFTYHLPWFLTQFSFRFIHGSKPMTERWISRRAWNHPMSSSRWMMPIRPRFYKKNVAQGGAPVRERVQLVNISTISRLGWWGLYRTSYWDYKPTFTSLGGHHLASIQLKTS